VEAADRLAVALAAQHHSIPADLVRRRAASSTLPKGSTLARR
jgi:hypothetical protein